METMGKGMGYSAFLSGQANEPGVYAVIDGGRKIHVSEAMMGRISIIRNIRSGAFTAKFLCPFSVPREIFSANCRSRVLDCLDEILQNERWLQKLLCIDVEPSHFHCARIPW
jgi:hypothetical protein